jgi:hypothetical protein
MLGLLGNEKTITTSFQTFCCLCQRKIEKNEEVLTLDPNSTTWLAHKDCGCAKDRLHKKEFKEYVKHKPKKSLKKAKNRVKA